MTIIAWDGKTLAADKMAVCDGQKRTARKIFRLNSGELFGGAGDLAFCLQMKAWVEKGCIAEDFPASQKDKDDWQVCVVVGDKGLRLYERTPYPLVFEDAFYACGSGREYATAAMHLGKTAKEAVEISCLFDSGCGNGVDTLELLP